MIHKLASFGGRRLTNDDHLKLTRGLVKMASDEVLEQPEKPEAPAAPEPTPAQKFAAMDQPTLLKEAFADPRGTALVAAADYEARLSKRAELAEESKDPARIKQAEDSLMTFYYFALAPGETVAKLAAERATKLAAAKPEPAPAGKEVPAGTEQVLAAMGGGDGTAPAAAPVKTAADAGLDAAIALLGASAPAPAASATAKTAAPATEAPKAEAKPASSAERIGNLMKAPAPKAEPKAVASAGY